MQGWVIPIGFQLGQIGPSASQPVTAAPAAAPEAPISPASTTTAPAAGGTAAPAPPPQPKGIFDSFGVFIFIIPLVLIYLFMFRNKNKDEKVRKKMIEEMKRGDKVMTIGGQIGSVVEVRGDEVVLKVDESNNIKMRFVKSAIQKVLGDEKGEEKK